MPSVITVFIYALITALATGLGALPLLFFKRVPKMWLGLGYAIAAGLMLSASFNLIYEGIDYNMWRTVGGILLGLILITLGHHWLSNRDVPDVGSLAEADAIKALLIVGVMTVHSFAEGIGVGVAFGGGDAFGKFISIAIAVHNIPEGLAIALVLVPRGVSVPKAAWWAIFSSLPQPLMAVPAFLFVQAFEPFLPIGLGLAAGAMIWMVASEIMPDAAKDAKPSHAAIALTVSVAAMIIFQVLLDSGL